MRAPLARTLRQAVLNRIRDEIRRVKRQPEREALADGPSSTASPLEVAIGTETVERYERALGRLSATRSRSGSRGRRDELFARGTGDRPRQTDGQCGARGRGPCAEAACGGNAA